MTNLLDERIDHNQSPNSGYGNGFGRTLLQGTRYKGIADTIVQLIRRSTSGVITPSQPIRSEERYRQETCQGKTIAL
jgi:hypothetical protein